MLLSTAIRLGGMMTHQIFKQFIDDKGGSCAIGGALLAVGRQLLAMEYPPFVLYEYFPVIRNMVRCPACDGSCIVAREAFGMYSIITHLNDQHRWSRERIADWVETIEDQYPAEQSTEQSFEQTTESAPVREEIMA